ncbi:MAG: hypothetical protein M1450_00485 [Patescibacteria group bacterium]|nr:hypothetical protein [Patescibacteria group bacterium]
MGVGAFFGGMNYQGNKLLNSQSFRQGRQMMGGSGNFQGRNGMMGGNRAGLRPVTGDIVSADNNSITVKLSDGSTKIVILSQSTAINKSEKGSKSDLKTGEKIAAFGSDNSDGSITAQNIQINPEYRGRISTSSAK